MEVNKDFFEVDFEGDGLTMISTKASASLILIEEEKAKIIVVKGKIGKREQVPIKNLRRRFDGRENESI
ncbi:MAG: hypothetical protein AAB504_02830 [Patescibacteria group bacterium]